MSPPSKEDTFFLSCLSITKVCTCNSQKFVLPSHKSLYSQVTKVCTPKSQKFVLTTDKVCTF
jgi:hypothetical protein